MGETSFDQRRGLDYPKPSDTVGAMRHPTTRPMAETLEQSWTNKDDNTGLQYHIYHIQEIRSKASKARS
jgi:hypothetical protein